MSKEITHQNTGPNSIVIWKTFNFSNITMKMHEKINILKVWLLIGNVDIPIYTETL